MYNSIMCILNWPHGPCDMTNYTNKHYTIIKYKTT